MGPAHFTDLLSFIKKTSLYGEIREDYLFSCYYVATQLAQFSTIIEIGCYGGDSTLALALGAKETNSHVYTIDPVFISGSIIVKDEHNKDGNTYEAGLDHTAKRFQDAGLADYITIVPDFSEHYQSVWDKGSIHLLLVDGEHTYGAIQQDCRWMEHMPVGGLAAFDDWFKEIEQSVKDYVRDKQEWVFLHESTMGHLVNGFNLTVLQKVAL